nr:hypothetical protein [Paracoccus lutimaris]
MDVTRDSSLSSGHTEFLRDPRDGYSNWTSFVEDLMQEKRFVTPILQINTIDGQSWDEFSDSICKQFDVFARKCQTIGYRASAKRDQSFDADLIALQDRIGNFTSRGGTFRFFLDYDYIRPGTGELHAYEASKILDVIHELIPDASPVLVATSFPSSVTDVAGENSGEFAEEEVKFHEVASRLIHNKFANVIFSDYGSINPIRNDGIVMANGWRPRIDYPFKGDRIFYYREKRKSIGKGKGKEYLTTYSQHYRSVASSIVSDERFKHDIASSDLSSWGVSQIRMASSGGVPSSSPSFWISVRMNIHIQQQLRRLGHYASPLSTFD